MLTQEDVLNQEIKLAITLNEGLMVAQLVKKLPIEQGLELYGKLENQLQPIIQVANKKLEAAKASQLQVVENDSKSKAKPKKDTV